MNPNPFSGLIHSRKFLLAMLDLVMGMATYFVAKYAPSAADDVKFVFATIQPVLLLVIASIAYEDKARLESASRDLETKAYSARTVTEAKTEAAGQGILVELATPK